ncbi:M15 family metallopeptidase [Kineosporia babensis]|uniref:D-alanyl-D-alanine carboxypeptidase family protein n=1 Tax=Kineosporia babensis TaxID=499548 RepID=A0A9X1NMQ4_9ACTN|nr:D-alanyl-D-alanine carboxypeptidase family protein [Kineosporia babensis]
MNIRRRLPVLLVAGVLVLTTPDVAGAAEREPTQAELQAQNRKVDDLRAQAEAQAGEVRDARKATRAAAVLASQALEAYTTSLRELQRAQVEEDRRDEELEQANQDVIAARLKVGTWARQAYQGGSGLNASPTLNTLLGTNGAGRDEAGLSATLRALRRIGEDRTADLSSGRRAELRAGRAAVAAAQATETASTAADQADRAKVEADAAVARQRRALDEAEIQLAGTDRQVRQAQKRQRRLRARAARPAGRSGPVGTCTGAGDLSLYPNGEIPLTALCPLASAPGHHLRADAAFAFDQLSAAYAERFGTPICVTDSYREYRTQVRLYATKPNLAARPGTSNHGWGTATDLCGGIQNFGTPEHEWLFANAPGFGWFHPAWAQPDGSRPEAWHWEFSG